MLLFRMILINILRHRVRTLIGVVGIALGVATMLSVVGLLGGAVKMFERILRSDAEMVVFEKNVSDLFFSNVKVELADELAKQPFVRSVQPVLFAVVTAPDRPMVTCFGIRADDGRLRRGKWIQGSVENFSNEGDAIVLGERAANFLNAKVGEKVTLGLETYPIAGVMKLENGFENGGVFMPLKKCQSVFHKEGVVSILSVGLNADMDSQSVKQWAAKNHPNISAMVNDEFSQNYSQFKIIKTTAWVVGGFAFLLGGLSVMNTMILSVFSRMKELAISRVCGFSRMQVVNMIFGEALMISFTGVILGYLMSDASMWILGKIPSLQGYIEPSIGLQELMISAGLATLTALIGSIYPAWYAARLKPASALRFE